MGSLRPRRSARRASSRPVASASAVAVAISLGAVASIGCALTQRPSVKVVDPTLMAEGTELTRARQKGGFTLGPYSIHDVGMRNEAADLDGPLASEHDVRRPVTQHRAGLVMDAPTDRAWTTSCTLQRRPSASIDYRAVLDENGDEIAVDCIAKARGLPPWSFTARAVMSQNFVGTLAPDEDGDDREWTIEVLTRVTYIQRIQRMQRLLPVPVVQLRDGERAVVAMLLGRPERAWVADDFDPLVTEAALAVSLTLRYLPWELAE